ncbi:hypothetical protein AcW1_007999 [Taiwanofungus camphoratus]|nr:hypothetical protein AcW1_007999 [Antrodia cinnamomea]
MSSDKSNTHRSQPIPIEGHRHSRRRSESVSESSSSESSASPTSPFLAPMSGYPPKIAPLSPSSSPILNYFLGQSSPTKSPASTFPFRRPFGAPVIEDDEAPGDEKPVTRHARRASAAWAGSERPAHPPIPVPSDQQDRAAGLFRRLSLGGALTRPQPPMLKPVSGAIGANAAAQVKRSGTPPNMSAIPSAETPRRQRRSNTVATDASRPPRAPSPMGERILKGHFDGFN